MTVNFITNTMENVYFFGTNKNTNVVFTCEDIGKIFSNNKNIIKIHIGKDKLSTYLNGEEEIKRLQKECDNIICPSGRERQKYFVRLKYEKQHPEYVAAKKMYEIYKNGEEEIKKLQKECDNIICPSGRERQKYFVRLKYEEQHPEYVEAKKEFKDIDCQKNKIKVFDETDILNTITDDAAIVK